MTNGVLVSYGVPLAFREFVSWCASRVYFYTRDARTARRLRFFFLLVGVITPGAVSLFTTTRHTRDTVYFLHYLRQFDNCR